MITLQKSNQLKSIAILMMLFLHLFNRPHEGLFVPLVFIGSQPLSYYISLFCDACVPVFAFVSGYGLYFKYKANNKTYGKDNLTRLKNLYINYWIILLLFAVFLGFILNSETHPGNWQKFLLNVTALDPSYNGAWWFFTTYVLFVLSSSFWFRMINSVNPYLLFSALLLIYIIAFYYRIYRNEVFDNTVLHWLHRQSALYFCTLFQFMLGAFALKYNWHQKFSTILKDIKYKPVIAVGGIILLIIFHGIIPNFIVAPFTGLGFILLFLQIKQPDWMNRFLDFMAPHATNLWLIHMFLYVTYFREFVYSPKYVLLVFLFLIALCTAASYLVKLIEKPIKKMINA